MQLRSRPILATSSSEFALPHPPASASSSGFPPSDETIHWRFRRPSLLAEKTGALQDGHSQSPLAGTPLTILPRNTKRRSFHSADEDMISDGSPSSSSEIPTPPLGAPIDVDSDSLVKRRRRNQTPPRSHSLETTEYPQSRRYSRTLHHTVKQPRILNLMAESRTEENEVKSEAAFQRIIASGHGGLPGQSKTSRPTSDKGRFPEEAPEEEMTREETPSDDDTDFIFPNITNLTEPASISGRVTPANGSVNDDDSNGAIWDSPMAMDLDNFQSVLSPSVTSSQWRFTPPPTSAVRNGKRKLDDRYEPYPAAKRRAVSPSLSLGLSGFTYPARPRTPGTPRTSISYGSGHTLPISIPVSVSVSAASSATNSPTMSAAQIAVQQNNTTPRPTININMANCGSPSTRNSLISSPVLRPVSINRARRHGHGGSMSSITMGFEDEEREREQTLQGAGEGVNGLKLA